MANYPDNKYYVIEEDSEHEAALFALQTWLTHLEAVLDMFCSEWSNPHDDCGNAWSVFQLIDVTIVQYRGLYVFQGLIAKEQEQ